MAMTEQLRVVDTLNALHLFSSQLPIGAFAFSQALEAAIESRVVYDAETLTQWCVGVLEFGLATLDFVALRQLMRSASSDQWLGLNARLLASRETHELRQEDCLLGQSLTRWARGIAIPVIEVDQVSVVSRYAEVAHHWSLPESVCVLGFGWSWLENQMVVAAKTIPLGQQALAQVVTACKPRLLSCCDRSIAADTPWANSAFMQSLLSAQHETQYSRLFRS